MVVHFANESTLLSFLSTQFVSQIQYVPCLRKIFIHAYHVGAIGYIKIKKTIPKSVIFDHLTRDSSPTLEWPSNLGNMYEEHPSATRPKEVNGVWKYACKLR